MLSLQYQRVAKEALLDSGATENFIHPQLVKELQLVKRKLSKPCKVQNIDGTFNKLRDITHAVHINVKHREKGECHTFLIADTAKDDLILGYPFFKSANPQVDWTNGTIIGEIKMYGWAEEDYEWIKSLPDWEEGDELWIRVAARKMTVAQQLAKQAADKRKKTWEELVPPKYHSFSSIFSEKVSERFPDCRKWDHAIDLKADAPTSIGCRVYPLSPKEREEQKEFLESNLQLNRIHCSNSPYASGFFLIRKNDGKFWPVQDYHHLNKWTIHNHYLLPLIAELILNLAGKQIFSKFDVQWGHNNVRIKEGDEWKAAFKTSEGLFKPTVMFFGLTNSPATFQTMMDDIFHKEIAQGWLRVYMDDIIIATEDNNKLHEEKVWHFLSKLALNDLFLKPEKCWFHQKEVEYLGVIIGQGLVKMDPIKVKGITEWPTPTCVKDVRSFLGFCNFYRAFIPNFSLLACPLDDLTKKNYPWRWSEQEEKAF